MISRLFYLIWYFWQIKVSVLLYLIFANRLRKEWMPNSKRREMLLVLIVVSKTCFKKCHFCVFFGEHKFFFWGHWHPCFRLLVTSPLGSSVVCFVVCKYNNCLIGTRKNPHALITQTASLCHILISLFFVSFKNKSRLGLARNPYHAKCYILTLSAPHVRFSVVVCRTLHW